MSKMIVLVKRIIRRILAPFIGLMRDLFSKHHSGIRQKEERTPDVKQGKHHTGCFSTVLMQELRNNVYNFYSSDNWDYERFGRYENGLTRSVFMSMKNFLKKNKVAINLVYRIAKRVQIGRLMYNFGYGLSFLYDSLEDDYSKDILKKVIAYRILGYQKMKLPLNTRDYWEKRRKAFSLIKSDRTLDIGFGNWSLKYFELDDIGYPLKLYASPISVTATFIQHQYAYSKISSIKAQKGDYIIDAGGCWGDTALSFAYEVGANGKVYTFEFVPENLEIMKKNIGLNPELKQRIVIMHNALWSNSDLTMSYSEKGPASSIITNEGIKELNLGVPTLSIDDFVKRYNVPRIDFIKMDIEGAELLALKGAKNTISKYKPKLAISVYHSLNDLVDIPKYIESIDTKYKFYLDHYTIFGEETVLFAVPSKER
jgi:FkbM family methyltransferase